MDSCFFRTRPMASGGQRRDLPRANSSGDEKVLDQPKATTMSKVVSCWRWNDGIIFRASGS